MYKLQLILLIAFLTASFKGSTQEDELQQNYLLAIKLPTTHHSYYKIVINVKNLKTGEEREVGTRSAFLRGALKKEMEFKNVIWDIDSIMINTLARYFEFESEAALKNIEFDYYPKDKLELLQKKIDFDSLVAHIRHTRAWSLDIWELERGEDKDLMMYSHILFNKGILTSYDPCMGSVLHYVDREKGISPCYRPLPYVEPYDDWKKRKFLEIKTKYKDSNKAKKLFAKALYEHENKYYMSSVGSLFKAYVAAKNWQLKLEIIKLTRDNYQLDGEEQKAMVWQAKVDKAMKNNPNLK